VLFRYSETRKENAQMNDPQPDPNGWNSPVVDLWVDFTMLFCSLFC